MTALKAQWTVTVEVIPGQPVEEYSRVWQYTSDDYEEDQKVPKEGMTKFTLCTMAVHNYAMSLTDPASFNVVKTEFMWL